MIVFRIVSPCLNHSCSITVKPDNKTILSGILLISAKQLTDLAVLIPAGHNHILSDENY